MAKSSGISVVAFVAGDARAFVDHHVPPSGLGRGSDMKDTLAQNFAIKHEIGWRFQIDPDDLPARKTGPIVTNRSLTVPFDGQTLQIPPVSPRRRSRSVSPTRGACWCCPTATWWWPSRARAI